jgi:exodeoxyribonuclease VII large subunit
VAYAIYNCKVPVISAVGHETDYTVADLAADLRAPTPSAAAELATPDIALIYEKLSLLERRIEKSVFAAFDTITDRFIALNARLSAQSPENRLKLASERLSGLDRRRKAGFLHYMDRLEGSLTEKAARLDSLSPLKVLSRGYSLIYKEEKLIGSSESLSNGDKVRITLGQGGAEAEITDKW